MSENVGKPEKPYYSMCYEKKMVSTLPTQIYFKKSKC